MPGMVGRELEAAAAEAALGADRWASKAGVEIELVDSERSARDAVGVLSEIWPQSDGQVSMTPELAWALAHSGNYVAVARTAAGPVAAALAFRGHDGDGPHLHSHMVGVLAPHRGASVGFAIKQHQRAWALGNGLGRVTWTFDPLVVRNAYFNVVKLGARLTRYYVDFYGELTDGINAGDQSDRCLVTWRLTDPRAVAAAAGDVIDCDVAALRAAGAVEVLGPDTAGGPRSAAAPDAPVRLARIPSGIVEMRRADPARGRAWRRALRDVLVPAFDDGLEVSSVSRDGCYVIGAG